MDNEEKKELTRREFLTWLAAGAALLALPGSGGAARAAAPSWAFADLDFPVIDMPADSVLVFPDPPPPIINPPGVNTPPAAPVAQTQAQAVMPYSHGAYAQYGAYTPQMSQGYQAVPTVYQTQARVSYQVQPEPMPQLPPAQPQQQYQQRMAMPRLSAVRQTQPAPVSNPGRAAPVAAPKGKVTALSRRLWADVPANPAKMRPMGQVKRITIHHEGSEKPNNDSMPFDVVETLRMIHGQHRKRMGAGDIGYHFIIDRTGMIWQGRDWMYQGAHTAGANANNMGVMLLGNFEIQRPTQAQLTSLHMLVASLVRKYGLNPARDVFGHSDFCKTHCPGANLRPQLEVLRRMAM